MRRHALFSLAVIVLCLALSGLSLRFLPLGEGRDELAHLQVVDFYEQQKRWPILPDDWADTSIEGHQPPLYYALMAVFAEGSTPALDSHTRYTPNPFGNFDFYPQVRYNRTSLISDWRGAEDGAVVGWRLLRYATFALSLIGLALLWRIGGRVFPQGDAPRALLLAWAALAPNFLHTAVGLNNNNLLFLCACVASFALVRLCAAPRLRWGDSLLLGAALGLGLLTKLYMFPLCVAAGVFYLSAPRPERRRALRHLALVIGLVLALSGWWYLRNYLLYGDPSAASQSEALLGTRRTHPLTLPEIRGIVTLWAGKLWLEASGVFTSLRLLNEISAGLLLLFIVGLWALARRHPRLALVSVTGVVVSLVLAVYGTARNLHGDQTGPIMRPIFPLLALIWTAGVLWIGERLNFKHLAGLGVGTLAAFALYFQLAYFLPQHPPLRLYDNPTQIALPARPALDFENGIRFIGYALETPHARPDQTIHVKLCWEALAHLDRTRLYAFTLQLVGTENAVNGYFFSGVYPNTVWRVGTAYCERVPLRIAPDTPTPRAYDLRIGVYVPNGADVRYRDPVSGTLTHYFIAAQIGVTKPSPAPSFEPMARLPFADLRYRLAQTDTSATLSLTWRGRKPAEADYAYFLHALDAGGQIVAQADSDPLGGDLPTRFWTQNLVLEEDLTLALPPEAVSLRFGLYRRSDGGRALWNGEADSLNLPLLSRPNE